MSDSISTPSPISGSASDNDDTANDDLTADLDLGFDGAEDILRVWRNGMRPDPDLTVSEWADAHRWLSSRAAAEPGRDRTARAPYLREIMDALSPRHPAQRVTERLIPASEGIAFPVGTMDTFTTYGGPANLLEAANTLGLPLYARQHLDEKGRWIDLMTEVLTLCASRWRRHSCNTAALFFSSSFEA
ncbi:major capsid protein [Hoeflea sp.]|uniref:major capsid protein n=1 Tax=Hoeflea sp. TaxID=1940281 RepID=UPI0025C30C04|nr:major capsid protein [Hoeflea sp.]